jgi:AcrR family transcriptional regulator
VSPRPYRLGLRADAVSETRGRVIAAARELFIEGGFYRASMDQIAQRADVARATIYHQFKSKLGVLEAVISDFEERAGLGPLLAVVEAAPPPALVRAVITAGCAYRATEPTLVRKVIGVASMQPEVQEIVDQHDAGRLRVLERVVDRLVDGGVLSERCSVDQAVNVLWLITSFDAYDLLTRGRRLPRAEAAETLVQMAESQLRVGD